MKQPDCSKNFTPMENKFVMEIFEDSAGISDVKGFSVSGIGCDIRNKNNPNRMDLAVISADAYATCAGVFTTNDVKAAPVLVDIEHLKQTSKIKAIVANSGNANACTGEQGIKDAKKMCQLVAEKLGAKEHEVLVCSTGRIGEMLPMQKIESGVAEAVKTLSKDSQNSMRAANAIMTSDTRPKTVTVKVSVNGKSFTVAGMAKGAGMIEPNMATMLCFICADVSIGQDLLKECLLKAANRSFNRITIDGDMSTNDTVLCMCNGDISISKDNANLLEAFEEALAKVCKILAYKMVADGEKITKIIEFIVKGASTPMQAEKICRAVANSLLVKSSWFGSDPNWGRIADSAGYARTGMDFAKMDLFYNETPAIIKGEPQNSNKEMWKKIVSEKSFKITMDLHQGDCQESILTTDLTTGYVEFNKGE